jgi:hypothetical protein
MDGMIRQSNGHRTSGYVLTGKGRAMCREVVRRFPPKEFSPNRFVDLLPDLVEREKEREP